MATSKHDISVWFDQGKKSGDTHLIVVCDTFDHEDYPIYCRSEDEALRQYDQHNGVNMQRVMEVYDLRMDKDKQMAEHRAMHLPRRT